MNELALAVFAARRDAHATDRDARTRDFAAFADGFDSAAYASEFAARGIRWLARSDGAFPQRLAAICVARPACARG